MESENNQLRLIIRQILEENFQELDESKKGRQFDLYLELAFKNITPDVPEGKFEVINILNEAKSLIDTKISKILQKDFEYKDFVIVKLGRFIAKDGKNKEIMSFKKTGEEDKRYSYMYLYIYNNVVELIKIGSSFFEPDDILIRDAKIYISNKKINLVTKTEKGEIKIDNDFSSDNIIDITDYTQKNNPRTSQKRFGSAYVPKATYKVGDKINHRDFGQGVVIATRKLKTEIPTFYITARFKQGDRFVEKTIRMQQKAKI